MARNFSPCESVTSFDPATVTLAIITQVRDGFLLTFETSMANWPFRGVRGEPCKEWLRLTETAAVAQMDNVFSTLARQANPAA